MGRQNPRLLVQRRDQAVGDAAVAGAFAHRPDARVRHGLHRVADADAAAAVMVAQQAGRARQRGVRTNAGGHHHQIGRNLAAVLQPQRTHPAGLAVFGIAQQGLGLRLQRKAQAAGLQRLLQQPAGGRVELAVEQPGAQMHHGDLHAAQLQAVGGLQPEQAAADHHRMAAGARRLDHGLGVGDVAVGDDTLEPVAGHRRDEGRRAGRQDQPVVAGADRRAVGPGGDDLAARPVDRGHGRAQMQRDAVPLVPRQRVQHDLVERLLAGQHRAEHDAVVVRMRLGTEHGDVVQIRRDLQQLLEHAHAGHAVADHHELHSGHCELLANSYGTSCIPIHNASA